MNILKETNIKVKQAFDLIIKKRLDGYVVLQEVGNTILEDYPNRELIKTLDKNFMTDKLYIPVSYSFAKKYPIKTKKFFEELSKARQKYIPNGL